MRPSGVLPAPDNQEQDLSLEINKIPESWKIGLKLFLTLIRDQSERGKPKIA